MNAHDAVVDDAVAMAFGSGATVAGTVAMVGDASTRSYERVNLQGAPVPTAVAMRFAPESVARSDEATAGPVPTELPFLNVHRTALARGVRVPGVYADLARKGCLLLEDLGDDTLFRVLQRTPRAHWMDWYVRAVDLLSAWQKAFAQPAPGGLAFTRSFDRKLVRWELDHFRAWALDVWRTPATNPDEGGAVAEPAWAGLRAGLDAEFDALADSIADMPTVVVHRDWQSKNLMVAPSGELAVIDFQDALVGPDPYDLVALLCDSYTALTADEQAVLIDRHMDHRGFTGNERVNFVARFWTVAAQRKLKDAGRFVFIDKVRNNPAFLEYIPQSVRYAHRALAVLPERSRLLDLLAEIAPDWFDPGAPG